MLEQETRPPPAHIKQNLTQMYPNPATAPFALPLLPSETRPLGRRETTSEQEATINTVRDTLSTSGNTNDNTGATTKPTVPATAPTPPIIPQIIVKPTVHSSEEPEIQVVPDRAGAKTTVDINEAEQDILEVSLSTGKTANSNSQ